MLLRCRFLQPVRFSLFTQCRATQLSRLENSIPREQGEKRPFLLPTANKPQQTNKQAGAHDCRVCVCADRRRRSFHMRWSAKEATFSQCNGSQPAVQSCSPSAVVCAAYGWTTRSLSYSTLDGTPKRATLFGADSLGIRVRSIGCRRKQ